MSDTISHCGFVAETQIPLLDGRDLGLADLLQEFGTSQFWIYSCDPQGNIYPCLARIANEKTAKSQAIKITLDSGDSFVCSEDQNLMRRDGSYIEAKNVKLLDSLMPLYRKIDDKSLKGYEMILSQKTKKWNYTHRLSASKDGRYKGGVVHHVNFNKRDNRPDNLQVMSWEEHTKLHNEQCELLNEYAVSEEGRAKSREVMSKNWENEEWRKKMIEQNRINGSTVSRRLMSEGRNGFQTMDKEIHAQRSRERAIQSGSPQLHTPEAEKKRAEIQRKRLENDEEFAKQKAEQARKNLEAYNQRVASGEIKPNEKQVAARRENVKKAQATRLAAKAAKKDARLQEHMQALENKFNNHKVMRIERIDMEDVYTLHVKGYNSFALLAGVFVR